MIQYFRNDFARVWFALNMVVGKEVPFGLALLYYIVALPFALIAMPFILLIYQIQIRRLKKELRSYNNM
jgi:hypothetical protein